MSFKSNTGTIIDRAINELRTGRPLIIQNYKEYWMFFNIEHSQSKIFNQFNKHLIDEKYLLITKQKAQSIFNKNIKSNTFFEINPKTDVNQIINLFVNPLSNNKVIKFTNIKKFKAKNFHNVCIDLSKNAKMIPSLVFKKINKKYYKNINEFGFKNGILIFDYKDLLKQNQLICESIKLVSSAKVPLPKNENSNFKIFKSYIGSDKHVAIVVNPKKINKKSVNLRIHSACFTGDIFHSLKCDCGEQLNQSINYMVRNNGGIILYLEQEGRGIGLANKMRAYSLQARGMDTIDADHNIGFLDDERDFNIAARILKLLKINKVNLITNNKNKINSIKKAGIKVENQINTKPTLNKFNKNYFKTRVKKAGYGLKLVV